MLLGLLLLEEMIRGFIFFFWLNLSLWAEWKILTGGEKKWTTFKKRIITVTETIHQKLSIHKEYNGKNRERKKKV